MLSRPNSLAVPIRGSYSRLLSACDQDANPIAALRSSGVTSSPSRVRVVCACSYRPTEASPTCDEHDQARHERSGGKVDEEGGHPS